MRPESPVALNADGRAAIAHLVSVSPGAPCVTVTLDVCVIWCALCHCHLISV